MSRIVNTLTFYNVVPLVISKFGVQYRFFRWLGGPETRQDFPGGSRPSLQQIAKKKLKNVLNIIHKGKVMSFLRYLLFFFIKAAEKTAKEQNDSFI